MCVLRINVTKNKLYLCHGYLLVQNIDCRLQGGYKMQTKNLKSFYVWYIITCHLTAYRASRNRFSAIRLHDYLHYCGIFLAHFLMKIDRNIISSLQYSLLTLCASWLVWVCIDFTNVIKVDDVNNSDGKASLKRQKSPKNTTDPQGMSKFYWFYEKNVHISKYLSL